MKKIYLLLFVLLSLLSFKQDDPKLLNKGGKFSLPKGVTAKDYLPNTLIIKFKNKGDKQVSSLASETKQQLIADGVVISELRKMFPTASTTQAVNAKGAASLNEIYTAKYEGATPIVKVINSLLKDEQILYAEPSYIYHTTVVPNDPDFGLQPYLNKVMAPQAWDILKNAANVIIGIVDSGSEVLHPDLASNIYLNTADPINGIDDDGDGYVDNYYGWDFVGNSAATMIPDHNPNATSDTTDHGIHVSGIASAVSNNGKGVASIAYNAKLLIVKAGADNNGRSIYKGYEGIKYAADHGAHIINCSWGGPGGGQFGQEMIDYALAKGILVIAAAGNDNTSIPDYPAAYKGVFSVASVTVSDIKSGFSNYNQNVDISAPGSSIYNTLYGGKYGFKSGTSMAAPMVASAAALVKAKYPTYTGLQVGEVLRSTADPIDNLNAPYAGKLGKGRLNVYRALTETTSSVRYQDIRVSDQTNGNRAAGNELTLKLDLTSFLAPISGLNVNITSTSPYVQVLDPNISVGNMGTLVSKTDIGPIRVKVLPNTPENQEVVFRLVYTGNGGAYTDTELYSLTVALDYLNVTVNKVSSTLTSNGRVGYSKTDALGGLGFVYKDENMLYEAALMIGKSANQVANNARNDGNSNEDFVKQLSAQQQTSNTAAFAGTATFTDAGSAVPIGLKVKSRLLAYASAPDDKYVIIEYEITNTSTAALNGIYPGLFTDWDLDEASANATQYDAGTKTAYAYAKKNVSFPYVGVKLLTNAAPAAYYPMSFQVAGNPMSDSKFTTAEKYQTLSSGVNATGLGHNTSNGYDIMFTIGTGPYNIPVNSAIKVAYAFIGGDNLTELLNAGQAAAAKYALEPSGPGNPVEPTVLSFNLKQNYPNPAKDQTTIPFDLAERATTTLVLSNVTGKVIQTLVNETLNAGSYYVPVNLQTLPAGVYFYRLRSGSNQKTLKMLVVK